MIVSLVDMKILDSPASTILVTNSEGARYDIKSSLCLKWARLRGSAFVTDWPCESASRDRAVKADEDSGGQRNDDRAQWAQRGNEAPPELSALGGLSIPANRSRR